MRGACLVLLALAALPTASAVPTTLYAHVLGPYWDFAMNTQVPDPAFAFDESPGWATHTLSCVPDPPMGSAPFQDHHRMYGYASPKLVDYSFKDAHQPRIAPERGVQADVVFDPAVPMVLHWYLSAPETVPSTMAAQPIPTPDVVVRATMRAGDSISVDDAAYEAGPVLAQGTSAPATLAGPLTQGVEHGQVGGRTVYHFVVPMDIGSAAIPRDAGFNLRVDVLVQNEVCEEGTVMPNTVELHTSAGHRPRLEFGVVKPLRLQSVHAQVIDNRSVVHAEVSDAWGDYDLASVDLSIEGEGVGQVTLAPLPKVVRTHVHGHYGEDFNRTWTTDEVLPSGDYIARVTARTLQGHTESWEVAVTIGRPEQEAPGLAPAIATLGSLALAMVLRRAKA